MHNSLLSPEDMDGFAVYVSDADSDFYLPATTYSLHYERPVIDGTVRLEMLDDEAAKQVISGNYENPSVIIICERIGQALLGYADNDTDRNMFTYLNYLSFVDAGTGELRAWMITVADEPENRYDIPFVTDKQGTLIAEASSLNWSAAAEYINSDFDPAAIISALPSKWDDALNLREHPELVPISSIIDPFLYLGIPTEWEKDITVGEFRTKDRTYDNYPMYNTFAYNFATGYPAQYYLPDVRNDGVYIRPKFSGEAELKIVVGGHYVDWEKIFEDLALM